ncbi:hypothetical protein CPB83DRAFT_877046 [Crepidotus variabilis]|uniref:G-patch domain-containing protein n=1 Tax=Crepidotus variabilis TaxID=179855 RepID=A0A9P6EBD0_9AGAR|nr:hypothetical protein CPB83DRAFT_877046 [Crepidotus variabilis]
MTSRLKRKLGDIGVDVSSKKANENFCLIGTPLPPLEKSKDTGEFVPLWKQEVYDEKGRRRLHGAFTGGWSAGYFNTVGTKEGWAPSTFVSSRDERAKKQSARPEDFMDEEDLQDLKDSRNIVDTTEEMDFLGGKQSGALGDIDPSGINIDPLTNTLQASLLPAPKDSVGAKILKKMGWRLGQGIGPRMSLKRRKEQDAHAYDPLTGHRLTSGSLNLPEDDEEADKHTYAPRDTVVLVVKRKDNVHGLGYVPGLSLQESLGDANSGGLSGPKLAGGFGLGALNDADDDDLDVYEHSQQTHRRRVAYDQIDGDDNDTVLIGFKTDSRRRDSIAQVSTSHFRNGRSVLAGFAVLDAPVIEDKWFPLPEIPAGWKPDPKRVWSIDQANSQVLHTSTQRPESLTHATFKRSTITADQRGALLGETPLPPGPRSVFDYMSGKDKERIQKIAANLTTAPGMTTSPGTSATVPTPPVRSSTTRLEPHVAQAALKGFQPFTTDPVKQARYTAYLQSQADPSALGPLQPLPNQASDVLSKELEDYAKAASLFKPMSGAMAGRFTSAAVLDMGPKVVEGLHQPSLAELEASEKRKKEEEEKAREKADPKVHAATLGMYGPMTREVTPWVPNRLLCKRFGVKDPDIKLPGEVDPSTSTSSGRENDGQTSDLGLSTTKGDSTAGTTLSAAEISYRSDAPRDITNIGLGEDETQGQDTLTYQRPSMDIFKAIFASDDEDEDEEEADDKDEDNEDVKAEKQLVEGEKQFTNATLILDDKPFDPNNFKPTFTRREGKSKEKGDRNTEKSREKKEKEKKEKKKSKKGVLVSFELEEGGEDLEPRQPKDRPLKKKRRKEEDASQAMVVDDPPLKVAIRKRAVDFMD